MYCCCGLCELLWNGAGCALQHVAICMRPSVYLPCQHVASFCGTVCCCVLQHLQSIVRLSSYLPCQQWRASMCRRRFATSDPEPASMDLVCLALSVIAHRLPLFAFHPGHHFGSNPAAFIRHVSRTGARPERVQILRTLALSYTDRYSVLSGTTSSLLC
jgi:hypothetical protein